MHGAHTRFGNSYHGGINKQNELSPLLNELNFEREELFHRFPFVMVIYTTPFFIEKLQQYALDLWSWVVYYYSFQSETAFQQEKLVIEKEEEPINKIDFEKAEFKINQLQHDLEDIVLSHPL